MAFSFRLVLLSEETSQVGVRLTIRKIKKFAFRDWGLGVNNFLQKLYMSCRYCRFIIPSVLVRIISDSFTCKLRT